MVGLSGIFSSKAKAEKRDASFNYGRDGTVAELIEKIEGTSLVNFEGTGSASMDLRYLAKGAAQAAIDGRPENLTAFFANNKYFNGFILADIANELSADQIAHALSGMTPQARQQTISEALKDIPKVWKENGADKILKLHAVQMNRAEASAPKGPVAVDAFIAAVQGVSAIDGTLELIPLFSDAVKDLKSGSPEKIQAFFANNNTVGHNGYFLSRLAGVANVAQIETALGDLRQDMRQNVLNEALVEAAKDSERGPAKAEKLVTAGAVAQPVAAARPDVKPAASKGPVKPLNNHYDRPPAPRQ